MAFILRTIGAVDVPERQTYAPDPKSLRSRVLTPSSCQSCGARTDPGESLCDKCQQTRDNATEDLRASAVAAASPVVWNERRPLFAPGQQFGPRYTIVEQIGSGGMGTIYKARDAETGRTVALKLIRADVLTRVGALSRFKRELSLAQTVSHPNVYRVHDLGENEGSAYISMEFIDGQSLDELIRSMGHLSPRQTVSIGRQICSGLQAIHEKSIVHRDLKPSNIMIDNNGVARLMDFGLAYQTGTEHLTSEGQVLGTMAYLSPEQARGESIGPTSDVFALGLILYEMLTGKRPPGDGKPIPLALRGVIEPCPKPSHFVPEIPKVIDGIVMRCLEREPAKRFPTAEALGNVLDAVNSGQTSRMALRSLSRTSGAYVVQRRRRWPWAVGAAALLVAGGLVTRSFLTQRAIAPGAASNAIVGIIPFAVAGAEAKTLDVAAGLADGLSTDIGDGQCAAVVPRNEMVKFEGTNPDAVTIAKQLGLTHVLTGTLRHDPLGYHAEMNLVAANGTVVAHIEGTNADAFALQRRLGDGVIGPLCVARSHAGRTETGTTNLQAFLAYSGGLRLLDRWDRLDSVKAAVASFAEAVRADPKFVLAQVALGEAYLAEYRLTREAFLPGNALNAATEARNIAPQQPRVRLLYARAKREMGESSAALAELEALVKERPRDPEGRAALGLLHVERQEFDKAIAAYEEARKLRPAYGGSYARLGYAYFRSGRMTEAIAQYAEMTKLDPENAQGFQMLGGAYQAVGDLQRASASYRRAIEIRPDPIAYLNLGTLYYDEGNFAAAKRAYEEAIALDEKRSWLWRALGDANQRLSQISAAKKAWTECSRLAKVDASVNKENAAAFAEAAVCSTKLGDVAQGRRDIETAVSLAPTSGQVLYQLALVRTLEGREQEALAALKKAIESGYPARRASQDSDLIRLKRHPEFRGIVEPTE